MFTHILKTVLHRGCDAEIRFWRDLYEDIRKAMTNARGARDAAQERLGGVLREYQAILKAQNRYRRKYVALHNSAKAYRDLVDAMEDALEAQKNRGGSLTLNRKMLLKLQAVCSHRHRTQALLHVPQCDVCGASLEVNPGHKGMKESGVPVIDILYAIGDKL